MVGLQEKRYFNPSSGFRVFPATRKRIKELSVKN
jgi:hypothetical protein